ncbi:unnamed protein product [Echinostoma caproni]|uniref:tRNA-binding domain-containing protein n=1 Tax=Echinostoma caproni TaxID=27848 RepID=A0A183AZR0_9TREM|nr:unnamed protein product [Echinostoma caproni]
MTTDAKFPVPVAEFRLVADVATEEVIDGVDDDVPLEIVTLLGARAEIGTPTGLDAELLVETVEFPELT